MKITVKTCTILLLACMFGNVVSLAGGPDRGRQLGREEILNGIPEGILNKTPILAGWDSGDRILFFSGNRNEPVRELYDIKSGEWVRDTLPAEGAEKESLKRDSFATLLKERLGEEKYGRCMNVTCSPDSSKAAYTLDNDLYVYDFSADMEKRLTFGEHENILNGYASWVYYEEILGRASKYKAFWWAPSGDMIAWYRFDESEVGIIPIYGSEGQYGSLTKTRYPKAGCKNPQVKINVIDLESGRTMEAPFDSEADQYFGIPFWSDDSRRFMVPWMNRDQDSLILYALDIDRTAGTMTKEPVYSERQNTWIDWIADMHFTDEGFYMVRDFEMWEQIYYQSFDGKTLKRITDGENWGVQIIKVDQKNGCIYFSARREISTRNDFYKVSLRNGRITRLSQGEFDYGNICLSEDNRYFAAVRSNTVTPPQTVWGTTKGNGEMTVVTDMKGEKFDDYALALPRMLYMEYDGYTLPAWIIMPVDLDTTRKYPVLASIYGGPNAGTVMDRWMGLGEKTQWWANEGVIQISIDHRASGHCGKQGLNFMHRNLLTVELEDYEAWMRYLFEKYPFIDRDKTGMTGFSYGGSMTALAVTEGSDYFKYGIAGGGVYDYALYDTHYAERYMDTPQDNPGGYAHTRLMDRISNYKGDSTNFLRITHGTADDNVHMQNTMQYINTLQDAGRQFELMLYPGEYHGYRGPKALHSRQSDYIFWYRYLLNTVPPDVLLEKK